MKISKKLREKVYLSEYSYIGKLEEQFWDNPNPEACWKVIERYSKFINEKNGYEYLWKLIVCLPGNNILKRREKDNTMDFLKFTDLLIHALDILLSHKKSE